MRVLYLHHVATAVGGSTNSLFTLIKAFPPGSVEATVVCPPGPVNDFFRANGVRVANVRAISSLLTTSGVELRGWRRLDVIRSLWNLRHQAAIRRIIIKQQPDIIHLNERGLLWSARLSKKLGFPVVMHARNVASNRPAWLGRLSNRIINEYVDVVVAIDESVRHSIKELRNCRVVYNPLDLGLEREDVFQARKCADCVRVTFLAGLLPYKGIWDLVEAARLLRSRKDIRFQIAGANSHSRKFHQSVIGMLCGPLGFAPDVETPLKRFVKAEGLDDTVQILGHIANPATLLKEETDILAFPSHLNGLGRSVFEAGVYCIPSVVSLRDRIEDIVEHEVTGLIVAEKNPAELARAIEALADSPKRRLEMGIAARKKYLKQFESKQTALQVLGIYQELLAKSKLEAVPGRSGSPERPRV